MADDIIAIQGTATAPAAPTVNVKTFSAIDAAGRLVEIQGIALVDEFSRLMQAPLTEATGQQILAMLVSINNTLVEWTNCGQYQSPSATHGGQ
jgi:hypothetical protein